MKIDFFFDVGVDAIDYRAGVGGMLQNLAVFFSSTGRKPHHNLDL
jgi:hypothetical protein